MLHDDNAHENAHDGLSNGQHRARPAPEARPLADREVELPLTRRRTPPQVHAWLDGELPETAVRRGDMKKDVEFWKHLNDQAERRRRMRTPAYVQQRIMEALPQTAPSVITPWYRREFVITPRTAALLAGALVIVGAAIAGLLAAL